MISLVFITGCGNNEEGKKEVNASGVLRVGLTADYPPFEFIQNKTLTGFDVDLANAIAKELGKKISIQDMDFDSLIPALQTGRIDCIIAGMTVTEERSQNVDFSIQYYAPNYAMLYKRSEPIRNIQDLNDSIIGVQLGSSMENFLKNQVGKVKNLDIVALKRTPTMVQELKLSRLDGVLVEEAQAKVFIQRYPELDYALFHAEDMGYSIAFAKGSPLREQVDAVLVKLKSSGELNKLQEKWLVGEGEY
jgi:polar amino acid transport system substrate-binding protein